jgi:hypothetical protein
MAIVVEDSMKALSEEQLIQIQNYGNKLSPLIMFYMLISVIIPALSITFLTIISSMVGMPKNMTMLLFAGLFVFVDVMKELPATLLLRPFNFDTLAVATYQLAADERLSELGLPALTIVLAGLAPVLILSKMISQKRSV